jgi:hypothetical protein
VPLEGALACNPVLNWRARFPQVIAQSLSCLERGRAHLFGPDFLLDENFQASTQSQLGPRACPRVRP